MYSQTGDDALTARMRRGLAVAAVHLGVEVCAGGEAWGYRGRTLGAGAVGPDGPRWLRLLSVPAAMGRSEFWQGAALAQLAVPDAVLRPRLYGAHEWSDDEHYYRAELFERIQYPTLTHHDACIRAAPDLDEAWWNGIVTTVDTMPTVCTDRVAVRQGYLNWAMPKYLELPVDPHVPRWTTAHADLHWANITSGPAYILDWERWGTAPAGWDAAVLHTYSLLVPSLAAEIRHRLRHVMETPAGRFAELAVIAEVMHFAVENDVLSDLRAVMRRRATEVSGCYSRETGIDMSDRTS